VLYSVLCSLLCSLLYSAEYYHVWSDTPEQPGAHDRLRASCLTRGLAASAPEREKQLPLMKSGRARRRRRRRRRLNLISYLLSLISYLLSLISDLFFLISGSNTARRYLETLRAYASSAAALGEQPVAAAIDAVKDWSRPGQYPPPRTPGPGSRNVLMFLPY